MFLFLSEPLFWKEKAFFLEGSTPKTKDRQVPGRWMPHNHG